MNFNLTFDINFPDQNYYRYVIQYIKTQLLKPEEDILPNLEDILVIDLVKKIKLKINGQSAIPNDIVVIPIQEEHLIERTSIIKDTGVTILTSLGIIYTRDQIKQIVNMLLQNHRGSLENKDVSAAQDYDVGIEIIHNNPSLISSINHFTSMADTYLKNHDTFCFDLNKLNILTSTMSTVYQSAKSPCLTHEDKSVREEILRRIYASVDHINDFYNTSIKLEDLAKIANLSVSYYTAMFAQVMHQSPYSYLTHTRINRAKDFLELSTLPIETIASNVGMNNLSAFYRSFKTIIGVSPVAYRKMIKN